MKCTISHSMQCATLIGIEKMRSKTYCLASIDIGFLCHLLISKNVVLSDKRSYLNLGGQIVIDCPFLFLQNLGGQLPILPTLRYGSTGVGQKFDQRL